MPTISVALIARNAAKTLPTCLESVRPHVDEIVVVLGGESDDDTEVIARKYADKVEAFRWINDFSAARQFSFSLCTKDWILWIDADDVVKNGARLRTLAINCPEPVVGYWFPYEYGHDDMGNCTTIFDRERFIKRTAGWQWQFRIHEVLKPLTLDAKWMRDDKVVIIHQGHDAGGSITRNIEYLLTDLAKMPGDLRTIEYLGNQYFALGQFEKAIEYWQLWQDTHNEDTPYRQWWIWLYMGRAYQQLGEWALANKCFFCALDCNPEFAEAYYGLGETYTEMGELERALNWLQLGQTRKDRPPPWLFLNPMDLNYRPHLYAEQIYFRQGKIDKAIVEAKLRREVRDTDEVRTNLKSYREGMKRLKSADRYMKKTNNSPPEKILQTPLPEYLKGLPDIQVRHGRALHRTRKITSPRIVFMCGRSIEDWYPQKINEGGIGGSETAVVEIAKRFAAAGWAVDVYNQPSKYYGVTGGVGYWPYPVWSSNEFADVAVIWRSPEYILNEVKARIKILWLHDLNVGPRLTKDLADRFDFVAGVSDWHADYLVKAYPFLSHVVSFPNGINLERFAGEKPKREMHRCVYLSSPDRGLDVLLAMWPRIVEAQSDSQLHVYYGWQGVDHAIQQGRGDLLNFKARMLEQLDQPGVVWHGRVNQSELAQDLLRSSVWMYPSYFPETFCISAVEAMAAGVVPVTSAIGALAATIGDAGLVLPGETKNEIWREKYLGLCLAMVFDPDIREPYRQKGIERAKLFTWDRSFERWQSVINMAGALAA